MTDIIDDNDPRQHRLALDHHPQLACEVGLILSAFAILELMPMRLLAKLIALPDSEASVLSSQFRSFGSRISMLESLIKAKGEESPESLAAAELISRLKVCGEIRNKYAHGLWSQVLLDGKNCVRLTNWDAMTLASLVGKGSKVLFVE